MASASSGGSMSLQAEKGQPWLFPADDSLQTSLNDGTYGQQEPAKRGRLVTLLASELNFHGENGNYASHHLAQTQQVCYQGQ